MRRAFSLIELLVVILVIGILAGMTLVVLGRVGRSRDLNATTGLVQLVVMAAAQYHESLRSWPHAGKGVTRPFMWDANGDGDLDGRYDAGLPAGYTGFLAMAPAGDVPGWAVRRVPGAGGDNLYLVDRWGRRLQVAAPAAMLPLRAASSVAGFPPRHLVLPEGEAFGVYSPGPDGVDGTDPAEPDADDVRSWR